MNEYKEFKVGDEIEILSRPKTWTRHFYGSKYPLGGDVKFPFKTTIVEFAKSESLSGQWIVMKCSNDYGWVFSDLIEEKNIKLIIKELTELPEKWCIKITEESKDSVADFYAKQAWSGYSKLIREKELGKYYYSHNLASGNSIILGKDCGSNFDNKFPGFDYTEITYDQFKKWVLKEPQFEVGKWYKITLKSGTTRTLKCSKINSKYVHAEEWCMGDQVKIVVHNNYWSLNSIKNIKELSIEEIQFFLPDNHPDKIKIKEISKEINMKAQTFGIKGSTALLKAIWGELMNIGYIPYNNDKRVPDTNDSIIVQHYCKSSINNFEQFKQLMPNWSSTSDDYTLKMVHKLFSLPEQYNEALEFAKAQLDPSLWEKKPEFIKGNWYKYKYNTPYKNELYYLRCRVQSSTDIFYSEYIDVTNDKHAFDTQSYSLEDNDYITFEIATIEEIQQYLPEGHPDKVKPKEFSKGTYIVALKDKFNGRKDACLTIGKMYEIIKSAGALTCPYINDDNRQEINFLTYEETTSIKWFAIKKEAEAFAETLRIPKYVRVIDHCSNNTSHPDWEQNCTKDKLIHRVVRFDENNVNNCYPTYVCEDGICLYAEYCKEISEEEYNKSLVKILPFGNLEFIIHKESLEYGKVGGYVRCALGKIKYGEIKDMVDYFERPIKILGYDMKIENEGKWLITFDCCKGTFTELKAIYKAFED